MSARATAAPRRAQRRAARDESGAGTLVAAPAAPDTAPAKVRARRGRGGWGRRRRAAAVGRPASRARENAADALPPAPQKHLDTGPAPVEDAAAPPIAPTKAAAPSSLPFTPTPVTPSPASAAAVARTPLPWRRPVVPRPSRAQALRAAAPASEGRPAAPASEGRPPRPPAPAAAPRPASAGGFAPPTALKRPRDAVFGTPPARGPGRAPAPAAPRRLQWEAEEKAGADPDAGLVAALLNARLATAWASTGAPWASVDAGGAAWSDASAAVASAPPAAAAARLASSRGGGGALAAKVEARWGRLLATRAGSA
jgi:hypothetical protein